jgi:hypothetical protein
MRKVHGLFQVTGNETNNTLYVGNTWGINVNYMRIDLQMTIDLLPEIKYRTHDYEDALEAVDWADSFGNQVKEENSPDNEQINLQLKQLLARRVSEILCKPLISF